MNHVCPNCHSRPFKFTQILLAGTNHGATCPSCGVMVEIPRWPVRLGGLVPFIPFWFFLYWKFTTQPPDVPELYAFQVSLILMGLLGFAYGLVFTFYVPLRKKA